MKLVQEFLIVVLSISVTNGSTIRLQVTPRTFTPLLTKSMSLTCAIGDDIADAVGDDIGTASPADDADQSQTRSFRTMNKLQFVTSIFISREGNDVASITEHFPASPLADLGSIKVNGSLAGSDGELTLTWSHPTSAQQGNYTCEVTGYDHVGHSVKFFGAASVEQSLPTIDDLVSHIYTQELAFNVLKNQSNVLESKLNIQEVTNSKLESKQNEQALSIAVLETKLREQEICCLNLENTTSALEIQLNHQETNLELLEKKSNQTDESLHHELEMCDLNTNKTTSELFEKIKILESKSTVNSTDLIHQIQDMQNNISDGTHIESGEVTCGALGTVGGHTDPYDRNVPVTFSAPYTSPPHVAVAVTYTHTNKDTDAWFTVTANQVTSGGFNVHCTVGSASYIRDLQVTWISHP